MTTTATATATKTKATIDDKVLAKKWADIARKMNSTNRLITKHTEVLKVQRVFAGRVVREIMALPSFHNKQGNLVKARLAEALGFSTTEGKRFINSVELVDQVVATGGTVSWTTGEGDNAIEHSEILVLTEGDPTPAEIEAYNSAWTGNAKKMRANRAEKSAKSADKDNGETEGNESAPGADNDALSFNDLVIKLKEVENTINALKLAGVELTDGEREMASNLIADMSASL